MLPNQASRADTTRSSTVQPLISIHMSEIAIISSTRTGCSTPPSIEPRTKEVVESSPPRKP